MSTHEVFFENNGTNGLFVLDTGKGASGCHWLL